MHYQRTGPVQLIKTETAAAQHDADKSEARALGLLLLIEEAARRADSSARLEHALRSLR